MVLIRSEYDWIEIKDIIVPENRYRSILSEEEKKELEEEVMESWEKFFFEKPILLSASTTGKIYLRDGGNRLEAAKKAKLPKVYCCIRVFDREEEALHDAVFGSLRDNWSRGQKDPKQLLKLVKTWLQELGKDKTIKLLKEKFSKAYSYRLIQIIEDEALTQKVISGEISIREAIKILESEEGKVYIESHVRLERGKPVSEEISAREPISEDISAVATSGKEISARKPRIEEIFKKAVEDAERELGRPMNATLKAEMEHTLQSLKIMNLEELKYILLAVENNWGNEKSEVQKKAVRIWRRKLDELGDWRKWYNLDYAGILDEARREIEEEKKAKRVEKEYGEVYREPKPREPREVKPIEVKPVEATRVEVRAEPSIKTEESAEKMVEEVVEEATKEFERAFVSMFPRLGKPYFSKCPTLMEMYKGLGPLGTRLLVESSIDKIRSIIQPSHFFKIKKFEIYPPPPEPIYSEKGDKIIEALLDTYKSRGEEILSMVTKIRSGLAEAILDALNRGRITYTGNIYLITVEKPKVIIAPAEIDKLSISGRTSSLMEALASMLPGEFSEEPEGSYGKLELVKVSVNIPSSELAPSISLRRTSVYGFKCPKCGKLMIDAVLGRPVNCANCGFPTSVKYNVTRRDSL